MFLLYQLSPKNKQRALSLKSKKQIIIILYINIIINMKLLLTFCLLFINSSHRYCIFSKQRALVHDLQLVIEQ